jgi:hypothetical protein
MNEDLFPRIATSDFKLRKAIDAACDRFEDEWKSGRRPDIAAYLAPVAPNQRRYYFRELLATYAALPGGRADSWRNDLLRRFPEYRDDILEVFAKTGLDETSPCGTARTIDFDERIRAAQRILRGAPPASPGLVDESDTKAEGVDETSSEARELWHLLFGEVESRSGHHGAQDAVGIEAVVKELLGAFTDLRRRILTTILLGADVERTAAQHDVTLRTVESTYQTARTMLHGQTAIG